MTILDGLIATEGARLSDLAFALRGVGVATSDRFALRDVSFELPTGYVMGLIGANGAGKTTAIRCLLGLRRIESGEAELLGHRVPGPVDLRQDIGVCSTTPTSSGTGA
ncbi:ATP-binding cassette domain-containing protein [Dactylosporangium sp. NPDC000244]|uniref:ATP-binding cassette domain-containing protein n=1 Tax=Dactylosporangium sp. NPDC000244 TaxID=3154365 RepID=UPI0033201035